MISHWIPVLTGSNWRSFYIKNEALSLKIEQHIVINKCISMNICYKYLEAPDLKNTKQNSAIKNINSDPMTLLMD